jgi:hypothetical protein
MTVREAIISICLKAKESGCNIDDEIEIISDMADDAEDINDFFCVVFNMGLKELAETCRQSWKDAWNDAVKEEKTDE